MKKVLLIIFSLLLLVGCRKVDGIIFKQEYESLNNKYTKVSISSDNPISYINSNDLIKKIENKEDMIVLFGYSKSNETRDILEDLFSVCKELDIDTIYYLDIKDIRDEKEVTNDEIKTIKEGTELYNKLLSLLENKANDYRINNKVVGKRIYAPTILMIKNKNIELLDGLIDNVSKEAIHSFLEMYKNNTCDVNEGC